MPIKDCFTKYKLSKDKIAEFENLVTAGMDEYQAARQIVLSEHESLHTRLNDIRKQLKVKPISYTKQDDVTPKIKEVKDKYKPKPKAEAPTPKPKEQTPVSESGVKKSNKGVIKKARGIEDLTDPRDIVMQYFAGGNKISSSAIKELFGGKDERLHFSKGTGGEQKAKISLIKGDAPTIKDLAHKLWEASGGLEEGYQYTDRDFRDAIESVLQDHNSPTSMSIELVDKYINQAVRQELTEQESKDINDGLIKEVTKYVNELPENQQSELVNLLSKYQDKFGFIDWDAVEKDSNGFDPDILSLTIETQEALDGIIQKNLKSGQSKLSDASRQSSSQEKGEEKVTPQKKQVETPKTQAKELADKVRKLKIDLSKLSDGGLQSNPLGLPVAVWNGAMDIVAATIEAGGQVADAVKRGINYIQKNHRGQWDKKGFNDQVMKELGVRGITVNGQDLIIKNDAKTEREFAETVNGWYSDLEQSVLDVKGDKGSGEQWKKVLGNSDEAKWTGLNDWLSQQKGQVSKKDIQNYLKDNRIEIVEVVKGGEQKVHFNIKAEKGKSVVYKNGVKDKEFDTYDKADDYVTNYKESEVDATKFSQYQLEGEKENYKEVLVTMPRKPKDLYMAVSKKGRKANGDVYDYYSVVRIDDPSQKGSNEVFQNIEDANKKAKALNANTANQIYEDKAVFKSSHFDEPNILVHLRMNTRTDAEGKKVLFLEEVQSDWGQKGKKEGFDSEKNDYKAIADRFAKGLGFTQGSEADVKLALKRIKQKSNIWEREYAAFKEAGFSDAEINKMAADYTDGQTPSAPFVTDTNSWTKLGLKVALKEAVKQGADKIAWTTGEQQNDRYDLSKQVDTIESIRLADGKYHVTAKKDKSDIYDNYGVDLKAIEDTFGKDIAQKISDNKTQYLKIEGENLKAGGKGMKGFYGSPTEGSLGIVGNVAKSLFKQEPKTLDIQTAPNSVDYYSIWNKETGNSVSGGYSLQEAKNKIAQRPDTWEYRLERKANSTQHSIDITPELKAEVEGGLPLFKDIKGRGKEIADLLRKGKIKMGGLQSNIAGIPIALYNTAIETIALALEGGATLTQAIQKAINKHKLNQQKNFNQKEFISKLEDITGEKFTDDQQEPPKPPKEEPSDVGIKHSVTEGIRAAYGLPEYERNNKTDKELEEEADQLIADGYNIESLISKLESGKPPSGVENFILTKYVADLDAKLAKSQDNETIKKLHRVLKATDKIGSLQSEAFRTRRYIRPTEETMGTFLMDEMEDAGVDNLTEEQKAKVTEEFNEIKKVNDALNKKLAELQEELSKKEAGEVISEEKKRVKRVRKTDKDFSEERKVILQDIKEKLKKARQDTQVTVVPYAKELFAIAPDVAKLVKSLVEQGVVKLEDVVANIHEVLKDEIEGVTPRDIQDIIAGEYNPKKATRTELAEKLRDLRDEASLLNKLAALENGEVPKNEKKKIERNRQIKELRERINQSDANQLSVAKTRIQSQIKKIEEQIKKGDFSTPKKKDIKLDSEGKELQAKLINLRRDREVRRLKIQYDKRNKWQKGMDKAAEIFNIPRSIMASTDFSAPLNQAIIATISHPILAIKAARQMFKSAFSQKQFDQWFYEVKETPRYELMKELKLGLSDPHSPFLTAREEAFMSGYAEQIPLLGRLIKGSERAYVQYLNKVRVDLFNKFVDRFEETGKTYKNSKRLYEQAAKYINNITGRGDLGKFEQFAPLFNGLFFSPRLMASRVNLINPVYFGKLPTELKKQYVKDMGAFLGIGSTIITLFVLYSRTQDDDDEDKITVELDARSSDFAKVRQGNTRWNIWGGFQPYIRLIEQVRSGQRKSSNTGLIQELDGNAAFGTSRGDVIGSFFRGKLAPVPSAIVDLTSGRNAAGEEVTVKDAILTRVFPLSSQGVYEGWKQYGAYSLLNIGVPSIFGVGTQTYERKEKEIKNVIKREGVKLELNKDEFKYFESEARKNIEANISKLKRLQEYKDLTPEEKISIERVVSNKSIKDAENSTMEKYNLYFEKDENEDAWKEFKEEILDKIDQ